MPYFPKRDLYSITPIDFPHHLNIDDEKLIEGHFLYERTLSNSIFAPHFSLPHISITKSDITFVQSSIMKTIIFLIH